MHKHRSAADDGSQSSPLLYTVLYIKTNEFVILYMTLGNVIKKNCSYPLLYKPPFIYEKNFILFYNIYHFLFPQEFYDAHQTILLLLYTIYILGVVYYVRCIPIINTNYVITRYYISKKFNSTYQ